MEKLLMANREFPNRRKMAWTEEIGPIVLEPLPGPRYKEDLRKLLGGGMREKDTLHLEDGTGRKPTLYGVYDSLGLT